MKINLKEVLVPSLILLIICIVVTGILGFTNVVTDPIIKELEANTRDNTRMVVLPEAKEFEEIDADTFAGKDETGNIMGYVITTSSKGYGGDISVMTGIDMSGKVTGVQILSLSETPGLGANAKNESFLFQYNGEIHDTGFAVTKDGGDIDSLTGATITSRAVTDAVNQAVEKYNKLIGEGI